MIETIVKRDGTHEPFDSTKLFKWAEWACKGVAKYVDWGKVVLTAVNDLPKVCKSSMLQEALIDACKDMNTWSYYKMAGRLYASQLDKKIFPEGKPTVLALHAEMAKIGYMEKLDYTEAEYAEIENLINHDLDNESVWFGLAYINGKYALKNKINNKVYETQQFVYMRMAMALGQGELNKMEVVKDYYELFNEKVLNAPTPNYVNLGTPLRGYASCCVYTTKDTADSLAVGDHIAYKMTCLSAGIGNNLQTRSVGDPVRGGAIKHRGKIFYYKAVVAATQANMQNGRGGAATTHSSVYDPEVLDILQLRNPRQTEDKRVRGMHFSLQTNKPFARIVGEDGNYSTFSMYSQPELHKAFYSDDEAKFLELYNAYLTTDEAKGKSVRARDAIVSSLTEAFETGTAYLSWIDEMNRHTAFKDPIFSSNLCVETGFSSKGYDNMAQLYSDKFVFSEDGLGEQEPEIGLCSLAAINVANVRDDDHYAKATYYALKMVDKCIHLTNYPFPHLELTAKARMNAGIGMVGLAHLMAKECESYTTESGKAFIHKLAETHAWHVINASLRLGKELGNAKWMSRTKWPDGWLPIDTYCKAVDKITPNILTRDWPKLRAEIIANKGIRNSCLINYMPSESSSKASETTNSIYPVRDLSLIKTDDTTKIYWAAPDSDKYKYSYEMAWDIPTKDMIDCYAIVQKWTDQSISADLYRKVIDDEVVYTSELIQDYLYMTEVGMKSRYYQNSKTSSGELQIEEACGDGGCKL